MRATAEAEPNRATSETRQIAPPDATTMASMTTTQAATQPSTSILRRHGLRVRPLPSDLGPRAVAAGHDDAGTPAPVIEATAGSPLRCCLRDAIQGEQITLITVVPEGPQGAYAERGPVFVHAHDCGGPTGDGGYPEGWRSRDQILRAYSPDGRIIGGELVPAGDGQEDVAARLFADDEVAFVQTRNIVYGCYMATIERGDVAAG